jgi:hypothetical protein
MHFWSVSVVCGIWTLPHLQRTCLVSLCYAFALSSNYVTLTYS